MHPKEDPLKANVEVKSWCWEPVVQMFCCNVPVWFGFICFVTQQVGNHEFKAFSISCHSLRRALLFF